MTGIFNDKLNNFFGSIEGAYTQITEEELKKQTYNVKVDIRNLLEKYLGENCIPRVGVSDNQCIEFESCDFSLLQMEKHAFLQCKYSKKNKKEMTLYLSREVTHSIQSGDYWYIYFVENNNRPIIGAMSKDRWERLLNNKGSSVPFKPRAQILLQLGEQLIKNENIAILELVKNSYDADAQRVWVNMTDIDEPSKGVIELKDDGEGMNINTIKSVWMEPGNNHKSELVKNNLRSKLGRLPIGEKGIGRFGVHKLGKKIELVSKTQNDKEVFLSIDWTKFENAQYLSDVKITIEEREPIVFTDETTGTLIRVENLSKTWTRGMLRSLYRSLNTLNSPFSSDKSFSVKLRTNKEEWLEGILKFSDIKDYALYEGDILIRGNAIESFHYHFKPYEFMIGVKEKEYAFDEPIIMSREIRRGRKKVQEEIDLNKYQIGDIKIKLYVFDRDSTVVNQFIPDKKSFKDYMDENGGISVFRDGIRVLDYGEPGNDWLGLDLKRINNPAKHISNNLVLGAVYLDRESSSSLKEKANREGFIEDEAYECFRDAVTYALSQFTVYRNIDKENIRQANVSLGKEPVKDTISDIRKIVANGNIDKTTQVQLDDALKKVENEFDYLKQRYVKTANAGLSYGIVIHEIEKIIGELKIAANEKGTSTKIRSLSQHLSRLVDSYAELLRNRSKSSYDLKQLIEKALFSIEYRLTAHKITIINDAEKFSGNSTIRCASNMIIGALINIIDNSIYWTTYARVPKKEIYINITDELEGYICIVLADNGDGYKISGDDAIKPFVSMKMDGLGLGLNIVNEIMLSQAGKLIIQSNDEVSVPKTFKNGAITILAFKKEKEN